MRPSRIIALGGLLLMAGCARQAEWTEPEPLPRGAEIPTEPSAVIPVEVAETPPDLEELPNGVASIAVAPPAAEVVPEVADSEALAEPLPEAPPESLAEVPAPSRAEPPRFLESELVLGLRVVGQRDEPVGRIGDLLLEPRTGEVLAVVVLRPREADAEERIVDYAALAWELAGSGTVRLLGAAREDGTSLEAGYADLFDGQETEAIQGVIRAIDVVTAGPLQARLLTVHDADNLFHRVLVEAWWLVAPRLPALEVGQPLQFEGVLTRDEKGKLWISSALVQDGQSLRLRDPGGGILWEELSTALLSARGLLGTPIETADGVVLESAGWVLDARAGAISRLRLRVDDAEHALTWGEIVRAAGAPWKTTRSLGELQPWSLGP